MLRRIHASSSQAKANPRRRKNGMSLREALASKKSSRSPSRSRSNGVARRRNAASAKPTLREVLSRHKAKARTNPDLLDRRSLMADIDKRTDAYEKAVQKAKRDPSKINKRIVERQRKLLKEMKRDLDSALASTRRGRKASTRKASTRKASSSRKKVSTRSKSGVANTTAAYKRLRARTTKSRFTKAFNAAYKKAKLSGKSAAAAQKSAIAAGKSAASNRSSARSNPSSALSAIAANAKSASRANPRKRKSTRKSSSSKVTATSSSWYKKLKTAAQKKKFVTEFNKAVKANSRKRGVSHAQAAARAGLTAYAKARKSSSRKNPSRMNEYSHAAISNPRKRKSTRKSSSKRKSTRKSSSKRSVSLETLARNSSLYKKLRTSALKGVFVREFKKAYTKVRRKASSDAQAAARAALSAYGKASKGNTRKNPVGSVARAAISNPRKRSSSSRRSSSSSRRSSSSKRARAKRSKRGMSKSAARILQNYGAYTYTVTINGKETRIKANKNSKEYKAAKRGGLKAVKMTRLKAKKNTPVSLNLRTVYKIVDGKPTRKDFQRAVNAWAGAIDGGKIRGVSKRDVSRARMNPSRVRKHTVRAISNPAPMSSAMAMRMRAHSNPRSGMDIAKISGVGVGSFAASLYLSNYMSSLLGASFLLNVTPKDVKENKINRIAQEGIPVLLSGLVGGYGLYKKFVKKADVPDSYVALCGGILAGSVTSLLSRTVAKAMGKFIPGFERVATAGGDSLTFKPKAAETAKGYLLDNQSHSSLGELDMSRLYGNHNVGRFVTVPTTSQLNGLARGDMGRYVSEPQMGAYVRENGLARGDIGRYVAENPEHMGAVYQYEDGSHAGVEYARPAHMSGRHNPIAPGRVPVANEISAVGANTQMVPNRGPRNPVGTYDMNADLAQLREDMDIYEPLSEEEMNAEGLTEVYANGHQLRIIRATPDVARQVVEANFGSIVGPSRVVSGAILVLANTWDHPQNPALTNHLRLGRAPEVPKGASFPHAGGVFSRVAFSSLFPSVNNSAAFQEFGVKI